jgi:hypothetical protein
MTAVDFSGDQEFDTPSTYVIEETCKDGRVIEWGFGSISDAIDRCEEIDPDSTLGIHARKATTDESEWSSR